MAALLLSGMLAAVIRRLLLETLKAYSINIEGAADAAMLALIIIDIYAGRDIA